MSKRFVVYLEDEDETRTPGSRHRVADGTAEQCCVMLFRELDTIQIHNLQTVELPRARERAVMDEKRVPLPARGLPVLVPAPGCEHGWSEEFE